jgi:hypothetical protein
MCLAKMHCRATSFLDRRARPIEAPSRAEARHASSTTRTRTTTRTRAGSPGERLFGEECWKSRHGSERVLWSLFWLIIGILPVSALELKNAVVVAPAGLSARENKAVLLLIDEVELRTHIRWELRSSWPQTDSPVIAVGPRAALEDFAGRYYEDLAQDVEPTGREGYRIRIKKDQGRSAVFVLGNDARGVLFGVGGLLRELRMGTGKVTVPDDLSVATAPRYPLRGHQLGYRPKTNTYDAWDLPQWEQYYRDLVVFGCNAVELIPPRSDDDADSPHFPRPPMEMMIGMSRLADDYGLDVWVWYPAMDRDYADPQTVEFALKEWGEVFRKLPRIDAVFVPGGDPGHTEPRYLMALLEKQTRRLHETHPNAQMWVSPQSFNEVWLDQFLKILRDERPAWLSGVVFGPQVRMSLPELRAAVPAQYPLRQYPDITHSRQCQFPVPDWDTAFAITEARECINPRPESEAAIFRALQPGTIGFLTYSEGSNDDVNKMVWSALGWDPEAKVTDILRQFSRYFIGERYTEGFAQGLLALERNWQGALLANDGVLTTLQQFQALEKAAVPRDLQNWRFQQALYRAYYDAYLRDRLIYETGLEARAMECLRNAPATGAFPAMAAAEGLLDQAVPARVANDWRLRVFQLAEALFQSIHMQLSVDKYQAIAVDRGASLDTIDFPLNDRFWLKERFKHLRGLTNETERLAGLDEIFNWTNPGPGGFYDDLGNIACQPHLVRGPGFARDPGSLQSPRVGFEEDLVVDEPDEKPSGARRFSWIDHAESLYDAPLKLHYDSLDTQAHYKIRVVYAGDSPKRRIRLVANDTIEIHPLILKPFPFRPIEFDVPFEATHKGVLTLAWYGEPGLGGNGRGCQVSEVWLMRK